MRLTRFALTALLALGVASAQKTTLTVAVFPDLDSVVKAALPGFLKANPNIDVKLNVLAHADHHNALTTAFAAGSGAPDVAAIDVDFIARFAEGGALVDLSKAPYNAGQYKKLFASYTFPQATTEDGQVVALPTDIGPGTMFYRRDILNKAGVKVTDLQRSWESYIEAGKKIKAANPNTYMIATATDIANIIIRTGIPSGEGLYFDRSGRPIVDNARFVRAFTVAKAVRDAKLDAKITSWTNEWYEAFKRGTVATQFSGAWLEGHLRNWMAPDTKGLWGAADLPEKSFASWGGSFYGIPKQSKHKAEAWAFVRYMTLNRGVQENALKTTNAFPALLAAQQSNLFNEALPFLNGQKARVMWRAAAAKIKPIDVNKHDPVAQEAVNNALTQVLDEGRDIKAALADAKALLERRARR
ncbi:multiple sugar transport system substrate-binding protein [Deinobacterium chartae]|uniref:Multiple sugar transport system substrate-binding protein n=1 Tax=Deinobacterium chartae TaxID=521158 RepID=A0A841HXA2_9DEIO|nr:extracellular solute-binding protein [Deinobacterium chartae]MBB6097274.1 multiple sugar transport system substrate-binding protein [Deinobacterium chartae]